MKHERTIRKAARVALAALLALVFWFVWDVTQTEPGRSSSFPSGAEVSAIGIICLTIAVAAGGYAVFLLGRAFFMGFIRPELEDKCDHDT